MYYGLVYLKLSLGLRLLYILKLRRSVLLSLRAEYLSDFASMLFVHLR